MAKPNEEPTQSSLKDDFSIVTIERSDNGVLTIDVSSLGDTDIDVITTGKGLVRERVKITATDNTTYETTTSIEPKTYKICDILPDGWIVGPISPTTGKPIAIEPTAEALQGYLSWHEGEKHAKHRRDQGHAGARQADFDELRVLFHEVAEKLPCNQVARFNRRGHPPYGKYWLSSEYFKDRQFAHLRLFGFGHDHWDHKDKRAAYVRIIRDEPNLKLG